MKRAGILAIVGIIGIVWIHSLTVLAQQTPRVQWIWHDEGKPIDKYPAETRYFRKVFAIDRPVQNPVDEGTLDITADDAFTVWVNGALVGKGDAWQKVSSFDVTKLLVHGDNVIAVEAKNTMPGAAGLLVRLGYVPNGQSKMALVSDGAWISSTKAEQGWQKVDFAAKGWKAVRVLGEFGKVGPWKGIVWGTSGSDDRFTVPEGFRVEQIVKLPDFDKRLSLVNLTFDAKGRLLVSRESGRGGGLDKGPIYLCTDPDKNGVLQTVQIYCTQVTNCQGMCWVKDALLLVGDGPQGTGLYRVQDTNNDDKTDKVELLHKFQGGMGEHGPHAIIHGPDDSIYQVVGNHAWMMIGTEKNLPNPAKLAANSPLLRWPTGRMGPDQGRPGTTEDVLLPRLNDARGHAANILAPGGTIWRMDQKGQNISLVTSGFRNHYDAAFSAMGELFTFDSDMEWDEALPWYRAVRVCHCPPGADFVWRTGAANTPDYYIDSLPPIAETGRGSPVGVEVYDHFVYPPKYRGSLFLADWAIGVIFAVHLERDGASYKTKVERFCVGAPMNVTDLVVGPDGALYFTMGGRGTQGGVFRIVYQGKDGNADAAKWFLDKKAADPSKLINPPQPLSAWSRARQAELAASVPDLTTVIAGVVSDAKADSAVRVRALEFLYRQFKGAHAGLLPMLSKDSDAVVRARAVWLMGLHKATAKSETLLQALKDSDALVRRRVCEALVQAGSQTPVDAIWALLDDADRFVRHAARLVLERIDAKEWAERIAQEPNDRIAWNAVVALGHTNQANAHGEAIFSRLEKAAAPKTKDAAAPLLDWLRTIEMALIHVDGRPSAVKSLADECEKLFPHADWRVNRELAILLTQFQRGGQLQNVQGKIVAALQTAKDDRLQQIHYAYCLRLLKDRWGAEEKKALSQWYDGTKTWKGGHSFVPFLENIFRETLDAYNTLDRKILLAQGEKTPLATLVLAQKLQIERDSDLLPDLDALARRLQGIKVDYRGPELVQAVEDALARTALQKPDAASFAYLVGGLGTKNPLLKADTLTALRKLKNVKPKPDDPVPFRTVLLATPKFVNDKERWQGVELLRQWTGRSFGAEAPQWEKELQLWARWFAQSFPKEAPLPYLGQEKPAESKYKMQDLLAYLENDPAAKKTDLNRGRVVFEKAQCLKCHKLGKDGEGVGPDLTALNKRFKRPDILEAIIDPSKVISDQYRSVIITTTNGQILAGLAAVQGEMVTVLLSDATKVMLKKSDIESQVSSLVSVMPERLLDMLTREEIADLMALMEAEPR